jgi:hypothetical protein
MFITSVTQRSHLVAIGDAGMGCLEGAGNGDGF